MRSPRLASDADVQWREWPAGLPLVRVHDSAFGATEPHPGPDGAHQHGLVWPKTRFAHFRPALTVGWVPSVYGGTSDVTAIAETMLRGQDRTSARPVHLRWPRWTAHMISTIAPRRPLHLLVVHDPALTATGPRHYPTTVTEAARLHKAHREADGLVWTSRQHLDGEACLLWVDEPADRCRVARTDLTVVDQPIAVTSRDGQERVLAAAETLEVMVVAETTQP
ncbi:hypothetical protein BH23ACT9_BH23ACT9_06780 [soil metagenome]